jgi:ornithine lipid hydroxylase
MFPCLIERVDVLVCDENLQPEMGNLAKKGHSPEAIWRLVFRWTIFPGVFFGALLFCGSLLNYGVAPELAGVLAILPAVLLVIAAEQIQPHSALWSKDHGDVLTDFSHALFSQLLPPKLIEAVAVVSLASLGSMIADKAGMSFWPDEWPFLLQLGLAMVIGEFGSYWFHRGCHETSLLWRLHAVHHSSPRLYWLNAGRFHPLDTAVSYCLTLTPLMLLGCCKEVLILSSVFTVVHGIFQHSNIDLKLGPLNYVFSMTELHRWHHSKAIEDANSNYGANLIVWDIVFGTRFFPNDRDHDPKDVGFEGMESYPGTFIPQLCAPFKKTHHSQQAHASAAIMPQLL